LQKFIGEDTRASIKNGGGIMGREKVQGSSCTSAFVTKQFTRVSLSLSFGFDDKKKSKKILEHRSGKSSTSVFVMKQTIYSQLTTHLFFLLFFYTV